MIDGMKSELERNERHTVRFFLVNHGRYYAKEILFGCVFIPKDCEEEAEQIRKMKTGDIIFHVSKNGISAVGRVCRPCRVLPYPAWRYGEGVVGARGYWADTKDVLLKTPIATAFLTERYLMPVSGAQAEELFSRISAQIPDICELISVSKSGI